MNGSREPNPLVERVDALMRRHRDEAHRAEESVPVLTEVVAPEALKDEAPRGADALAAEIERALLERLAPEIQALVRRAVREAVARALAVRAPDDHET
jgi:hypothetical protein